MAGWSTGARENRIPLIHRARGYRLYGEDGRRYIDFYQDGGRALLGHRPAGWTRIVKSTGNRGLCAPYPSRFAGRARRAVLAHFPWARDAHVFPDICTALAALSRLGGPADEGGPVYRPRYRPVDALTSPREELEDPLTIPLLRPFGPGWTPAHAADAAHTAHAADAAEAEDSSVERALAERLKSGAWGRWLIPLIPIPGEIGAVVLLELPVGDPGREAAPEGTRMPGDGEISPLSEELMVRALSDLSRFMEDADRESRRLFDLPGFVRRGPYLLFEPRAAVGPRTEAAEGSGGSSLDASGRREYNELFEAMLERGVLLPPDPAEPAIIPGEYSDGEVQPLIRESRRRYADS